MHLIEEDLNPLSEYEFTAGSGGIYWLKQVRRPTGATR